MWKLSERRRVRLFSFFFFLVIILPGFYYPASIDCLEIFVSKLESTIVKVAHVSAS